MAGTFSLNELKSDFFLLCSYSLLNRAASIAEKLTIRNGAVLLLLLLLSVASTISWIPPVPSLFLKLLCTLNTFFSFMLNWSNAGVYKKLYIQFDWFSKMYMLDLYGSVFFYIVDIKSLPKAQRTRWLSDVTKITSLVHITCSYTNLDQISTSESWPSINFKISTKL